MRNIQCKNCGQLRYGWCKPRIDSPDPELVRDCSDFKQKTNMDIIQHSYIDDLALFIRDNVHCKICQTVGGNYPCTPFECAKKVTQWLLQEVFV